MIAKACNTSIGNITMVEKDGYITNLFFEDDIFDPSKYVYSHSEIIDDAFVQLNMYLNGERLSFDLPLAPVGTDFMKNVWSKLVEIKYGQTCSYKDIAHSVGNNNASRAVGMANNKNPIPIFIPCHRVIGSGGKLVGYRGGLEIKQKLLNLEKSRKYFDYGDEEMDYLKSKCPKLGNIIAQYGKINRIVNTDIFSALTSSIISQQISTKAALTINSKLRNICEISPKEILNLSAEQFLECGISPRKLQSIKEIAVAFLDGDIPYEKYSDMSDEDIIENLIKFNNIGVWTAEMLLIFSLERADILSYGDLGIRKALSRIYGIDNISKGDMKKYEELFSPYSSIASFYLWEYSRKINKV